MGQLKKISDKRLIDEYEKLSSVWKVAEAVGICGQSVHERLVRLGKIRKMRVLTDYEKKEIERVYRSGIKRGDGKLSALSEKINRTIPFISRYARKIGLTSYKRTIADKKYAQDAISSHPLSPIYYMIMNRCYNKNSKGYANYGSRGVYVCERWRKSFEHFVKDMGPRPTARHSVDRVDNDGPYSPENCKWATPLDQANNKRCNRLVIIGDEEMTFAQACRMFGINYGTAFSRAKKSNDPREIFKPYLQTTPPRV